jgi:hypothetical protein
LMRIMIKERGAIIFLISEEIKKVADQDLSMILNYYQIELDKPLRKLFLSP